MTIRGRNGIEPQRFLLATGHVDRVVEKRGICCGGKRAGHDHLKRSPGSE
jgi:hypothetical protein